MQPLLKVKIVEAREALDLQVEELARRSGLSVNARAERQHAHARLLVAERDGEVLGFVLGWLVADELEVVDIAVTVDSRRQGLGESLLVELFAHARRMGCRGAFLEVRASNVSAQALYRRMGFEQTGTRLSYYGDGEDAWLFRCCLQPIP